MTVRFHCTQCDGTFVTQFDNKIIVTGMCKYFIHHDQILYINIMYG